MLCGIRNFPIGLTPMLKVGRKSNNQNKNTIHTPCSAVDAGHSLETTGSPCPSPTCEMGMGTVTFL